MAFSGKISIGKGMFPAPDNMAQMMKEKIAHLNQEQIALGYHLQQLLPSCITLSQN